MPQEVYNIVVNVAVSVWLSILNDFTIISKTCKGFSVGCFTQTFILPCFYTHAHKYIYSMLYIHICVIYVHICVYITYITCYICVTYVIYVTCYMCTCIYNVT